MGGMTDSTYMASACCLECLAFQAGARRLSESFDTEGKSLQGARTTLPFYFLVSHAAELFLKAALFKRRFAEGDLKMHGTRYSLSALLVELACFRYQATQFLTEESVYFTIGYPI